MCCEDPDNIIDTDSASKRAVGRSPWEFDSRTAGRPPESRCARRNHCVLGRNLYSYCMTSLAANPHTISVTEAAARGVSSLVRSAEHGEDIVVERHGRAVAAVVSMTHLEEISRLERDLRESVLLLARMATDSGTRTDLNTVINAFGLSRAELEAELDDDLTTGRE